MQKNIIKIVTILFVLKIQMSYLPYHAHGFNQTKIMWQLIQKNTRSFKVDISLSSLYSCKVHGDRKDYPLQEIKYDDVMGCLALIGDNSSIPYSNADFETTQTFLEFLDSEHLWEIISKWDTPLWFELDFQSHSDIKFEYKLLIDFLNKLIDIMNNKNGKIKVGGQYCFQFQLDEYCTQHPELKCKDNSFYQKLMQTKYLECMNNTDIGYEKSFLNLPFQVAQSQCSKGFSPYEQTENEYQFWEMNNKSSIVWTSNILNNQCEKLQNHRYKFTSNIDVDQFRNSYYIDFPQQDKIYFYADLKWTQNDKIRQDLKNITSSNFKTYYYIDSFDFYILIFESTQKIDVIVAKIQQNNINILQFQNLQGYQLDSRNSYQQQNNIYLYNQQITIKLSIQQNSQIVVQQMYNVFTCEKILPIQDTKNKYCINIIKKQNEKIQNQTNSQETNNYQNTQTNYHIEISELLDSKNINQNDYQKFLFDLPENIIEIQEYKVIQNKDNLILTIVQKEKQNQQQDIILTYMFLLNLKQNQISQFYYFIGQIQSIDIYEDNFIIVLNNCQVQYGHGLINNNDRNICFSQYQYNNQQIYRQNKANHIQYYYGNINDLQNLKENKLIGYCDEKVFHGNLGYSTQVSVRYVDSRRGTKIPLLIHTNVNVQQIELFSLFFAGLIDNTQFVDYLTFSEIPTDEYKVIKPKLNLANIQTITTIV